MMELHSRQELDDGDEDVENDEDDEDEDFMRE
jgi:hypothetical protein